MMDEIRYASACSGIGGFELGFQRAGGFKRVWSCDWDYDEKGEKAGYYANKIYRRHFKPEIGTHITSDIRRINPETIPEHDILTAGFPCQSFSISGKRKGFEDTRGTVFFEICRIAKAKRPTLLLLENVKGLLNHDRGRTFTIILQSLDELGYWVEWQVLNSKYFGVPQSRERVFIIGHLRERSSREIFPITRDDRCLNTAQEETRGEGSRLRVSGTLSSRYWKDGSEILIGLVHRSFQKLDGATRIYEDIAPTISTPSGGGHIPEVIQDSRIRKLTEKEAERLMGFPDNWTVGFSYRARLECLGNAVVPQVAEFLGNKIKESLIYAHMYL